MENNVRYESHIDSFTTCLCKEQTVYALKGETQQHMAVWNPWRGCHRCSDGCKYCYIHRGDAKKGINTEQIVKTNAFDAPLKMLKNGAYKLKSGSTVYLCFSSDFLLEEADAWREDCWQMIRKREDMHFVFLTKRIGRFMDCVPKDWGSGYENITVGCSVETQACADERLKLFRELPIKHKNIILQPMLEDIKIAPYIEEHTELVVVGGESAKEARELDFDWVLHVRSQCIAAGVPFQFRQCGTHFRKDGKLYTLPVRQLAAQARKADIDT